MATGKKLDRFGERLEDLDPATRRVYMERLNRDLGLFDTVINTIDEGVMVIDRNLAVKYHNDRAKTLLGLPANTGDIPMSRLLPDLDWKRIMPSGDEGWSSSSQEFETHYPEQRFLQVSIRPMSGDNTQAAVIMRDVTGDRAREKEAHKRGFENSAFQFGAMVAHEVRNPLNAIYLTLQLMEDETDRNELANGIMNCENEVMRINEMLTNLMESIRPDGGTFAPVDLVTLAKEVAVSLEPVSKSRDVAVEVVQPAPVPPVVGVATQLKQAFYNVMLNAIQAMTNGGRLRVSVYREKGTTYVDFADTGNGITPENLEKAFQPGWSNKGRGEGFGLGMLVFVLVCRRHGADFGIVSTSEKGTVFQIRWPDRTQRRLLEQSETK